VTARRAPAHLLALTLATCTFACGGGATAAPAPVAMAQMSPTGPGAKWYAADARVPPRDGLARAVAAVAADEAAAQRRPEPALDGGLTAAARSLSQLIGRGRQPAQEAVDFAARHAGLVEPVPVLFSVDARNVEDRDIAEAVRRPLERALRIGRFNRIGVASRLHADGETRTIVIALSERSLEMKPVLRQLPADGSARIRGRLIDGYARPQIFVTDPGGEPRALAAGRGPRFDTTVRCAGKGSHRVEVLGSADAGPVVLANFPVWCGMAPPARRMVAVGGGERVGPKDAERRLLELVNRARKQAGRPPLAHHDRAAKVARAHSQDMRDNRFVAHVSRRTGNVGDRARRAKLDAAYLAENIGTANSPSAVHEGLMGSPGHRAAILAEEPTHVGIGVAVEESGQLYATQVFLSLPVALDAKAAARALRRRLAKRKGVQHDQALSKAAQAAADAFAAGRVGPNQVGREAAKRAQTARLPYTGLRALAAISRDAGDVLDQKGARDKKARAFGVGVAVGRRKGAPADELFVVVLLGLK
jgi:hypothetical protein